MKDSKLKSYWRRFTDWFSITLLRLKNLLVKIFWHPRVYEVLAYSLCIGLTLAYFNGWDWLIPPASVAIYFIYQEVAGDALRWARERSGK